MNASTDAVPELNATVVTRRELDLGLVILRVRPDAEPVPDFAPGQFVQLGLVVSEAGAAPRLEQRAYSIVSSPHDKEALEFVVTAVTDGRLSPDLSALPVGGRCWLDPRPLGNFTLEGVPREKDLVLVATGTGIAPYVSMLRTHDAGPSTAGAARWRRAAVVHGVRRVGDLAYRDELTARAKADASVCYLPVVSREPELDAWSGLRGRVQSVLEGEQCRELSGVALDPMQCHVFLCGNPGMIGEVREMLAERGFVAASPKRGGNLHVERYW